MAATRVRAPKQAPTTAALPAHLRPRKGPSQDRAKELVAAVVEAGSRVLASSGYENLSMQQVAKISGVSPGSLYQYFPDKAALVAAIIERTADREREFHLARFVALPPDATLYDAIETMVRAFLAFQAQEGLVMRRSLEALSYLGRYPSLAERVREAAMLFRGMLEAHRGSVAHDDLDLATHVMTNAIHSLTHDGVLARPATLDDETLVREIMRMVRGYLG